MAELYTLSEARKKLSKLLEQASLEGEVLIKRKDGQIFVLKPINRKTSPLDVPSVDINISTSKIVHLIRESREKAFK